MTNPEDAFDEAPTNVLSKYDIHYRSGDKDTFLPGLSSVTAPSAAAAAQQWLEAATLTPSELPDEIVVRELGAPFATTFKVVPQVRVVPVETE